ncbi:hypothetical protein [Kitasatospora sp. NPDC059827]|uniref:WXG100-like domain-containing protein n=1 Tax=Kitasatospora sp. NPDC059827 TaxID=3346964 RepID=UPI00365EE456
MSHSSIHVSPGLAQFFHIISGMPWPESDEGLLRDVRDDYQALADDLPTLSGYILDAVQSCDKRLEGEAAQAFRKEWGRFVNTDQANDPLRKAGELCTQLAELAGKVANTVEYTKWMAIGQLVQLVVEIAVAIAWSVFTAGASMAALNLKILLTRQGLLALLKKLLQLIAMHTFGGVVGGLMLDAIIQGIQFEHGDRHEWDKDLTKQAAIFGAISGAIGGPLSLLGMGLGRLLGPRLSKLFVESALKDVIKGLTGGAGKDLAAGAAGGALKGLGKDLAQGAAGGALKGAAKDLGEGAAAGSLKGAGKEAGAGFGKLLGDEAAERFARGITNLLKDNAQYLAKGFKSGRKVGAAMGEKFVRQLGELFERELGEELGKQLARDMGEQIGKQFVQHSLKTVAKESSQTALKEALENLAKDSGKVALTPELKLLAEKMPELAGGINKMNKMFHLGALLGSQFESGINQYLTEGIYNTIYNGEWSASGMSFVGGFMMAGMRHMIMGLASPLTLRYADFVRGLESSRITDENGGFYGPTHPMTFLSVISNMGGHSAPFPVPRPGHIDQIGGARPAGGEGASIRSDGASIRTEGTGSLSGSTLLGSGSHHREDSGDGVLADPQGRTSFHSSVDGGWDPKAPVRPVETQSRGDERTSAAGPPKAPAAPGGPGGRDSAVPPPVPRRTDGGAENTTTTTGGATTRNTGDSAKPVAGGERSTTATASADANGQGGAAKPQPQSQPQAQTRPDPSRRTTVVDEHTEAPLHESTAPRNGGPGDGTQPQPQERPSHRSPAAAPPPPPIRTSAGGPGDGAAPATPHRPDPDRPDPNRTDPNRPDPNRPDPNRPDPNRPDPNRPDPNRPDPDRTDPRTSQGPGPDPQLPPPPAAPPRDPKPGPPGPDPRTPGPRTPDTAPSSTASGHLYHQVDAPEHAEAPAGDERRTAWRDRQRSLAEDHDARLAGAERQEADRRAIEEQLTQGAALLPRELRALVTPDSPVWRRAADSLRESIEARPHEREEVLAGAADRLELAGARELALTFAVGRFDRLLAERGLGPEHSGDHTLAEVRREASEKFRADAEQDVAQLFTARTDLTPERNALAARALERRLREAGRDLDVRQARARALEQVDRVVEEAHEQWSAAGLSEGERALLEAAGLSGDVRLSPQARDQLAEALRERLADLHGGDEGPSPRIEEEGGEDLAPVEATRLGRARLEADFQEALERHRAALSREFTVQAVREAVLKRSVDAVDDAAAAWKDSAGDQFGPEALRELGLADGPSPRAVAAARADLARRTDRLVAEHTAADRDPAHLTAQLDALTSQAGANRLLALHGAREEALRAAEDSARTHVPHDLGGPERATGHDGDAAGHDGDAAASVEMALGPVRGTRTERTEAPATDAARRVREGYTERVGAAFEETFRSLLRDPGADHRADLPEQLAHWRGERERLTRGLAEHVAFERAVLPARERAAAGYDRLAEDRRVPEAEIRKLRTEYGDDFFDAYRDHWAPEDLDGAHWRGHEATHENVFGRRPEPAVNEPSTEPAHEPAHEPVTEPAHEPTPAPGDKPAPDAPSGPLTRPTDTGPDTAPDTAPAPDTDPRTPAAAPPAATPPVQPPAAPPVVPPTQPRPLLPASAWADIRTLAPSARMDTVRFDARVRGQDNPGAIAGPRVREQYENREQRPGGLPRSQRSLGDLHGADTTITYDVRRFEARPGHWVTEFSLNLHLTGPDGRPLPQAAATRVLERARAVVADRFNERHHLPGGDQVHLRLESAPNPDGAHRSVTVLPGTGRSDQLHWHADSAPGVLLHELLHFLGLPDEYVEPAAEPGDAFALRRRDRWAGENGVMGTSAHRDDFTVLPRHLQRIEDVLHSGPVLREVTHGQYLTHRESTAEAPQTVTEHQQQSTAAGPPPAPATTTHASRSPDATPPSTPPTTPAPVHDARVNVLDEGRLYHVVDVPGDGDCLLHAVLAGAHAIDGWQHGELTTDGLRELASQWFRSEAGAQLRRNADSTGQRPVDRLEGSERNRTWTVRRNPGDEETVLSADNLDGLRMSDLYDMALRNRSLWNTSFYDQAPAIIAHALDLHLVIHEGNGRTAFNEGAHGREVHVYRDPGEGLAAHYSELRPDTRHPVVDTGGTVHPEVVTELTGRVKPDMAVVSLEPGQPVFRVTDAVTLRGYLLQGRIGTVKNKEGWSQLGPGLYTGHDFGHAAAYSDTLSNLPVVMEFVLSRKATGLRVDNITENWTDKEVPKTLEKYDFLTDGTQFKFHPRFFDGALQAGPNPSDRSSGLRLGGVKVKEGDSLWNHYRTEDFVPEYDGYLIKAHQDKAAQHPRAQDGPGPGRTPDPVPMNEALESAPPAAPEDLRSIRYLEEAEAYERRLATHLLQREDVQREVKKAVDLAWAMTTGDKDKAKFGSRTPGTTGMVGTERHMLQEVVDRGNLRERMALLYNGYTSNHFAKLVRQRQLPRPEQLTRERADRHDLGAEVVNPLIAEIKKVYGQLLAPPAEQQAPPQGQPQGQQPAPFGSFRTDEPHGPLVNRIREDYAQFRNRQLAAYEREREVEAARKAAERQAKTILETDRNPLDVNPPLGRGEWYSAVDKDGRLGWQPGAKSFHYKLGSAFQRDAHDTGGLVATGTSGTAFGMLQAVKELARTPAGRTELARTGGEPVDFELLRLGLLGWMLESGDHTFHEIMAGSRLFSESLTPEEHADPNLTGTDLTYLDTHHRYRFLSPLTERELREEVAPGGLFPDEHLVGPWSVDDPQVTGLTPDDPSRPAPHDTDTTDTTDTTGDGGPHDSSAAPAPPVDPVAVDLARRHLDAAAQSPGLYEFMGRIKAGAFTSRRDDEGMLRVREGERYESLLADVQRFLDHTQALRPQGEQAQRSLNLYRAVRMDPQSRGRDSFTELLPASTSFDREFVQEWMSNGGGADNYALFEIRVPSEHPMLALSFPPGHTRADGDPRPVNEAQSEVTLGPSRLTVTGRDDEGGFHVIRVDAQPMTVEDIRTEVANWSSGTSMADAYRGFTDFYSEASLRAAYPYDFNPQHRITQTSSHDGLTRTVRIEHSHPDLNGQFAEVTIRHENGSVEIQWRTSDDEGPQEPMRYTADNIGDVSGSLRSQTLTENPSFESLTLPFDWYSPDYDWHEPEAAPAQEDAVHLPGHDGDDLHQPAAAPPLPVDPVAVDVAQRHLLAAEQSPGLHQFMGWIKGGGFTSKRDGEGMLKVREGERYESLLGDVQRFLDHAQPLRPQGEQAGQAGQSLNLYRAVRLDAHSRGRDSFTELLPASTSFDREFVQEWMSNGGGADNYALFEIKVPLDHPMLALSFPPGHTRAEGDPQPVNEAQSEVTLGPSRLTVTGRDDDGGFHVIHVDAQPMTVDDIRTEVADWSSSMSIPDAFQGFTRFLGEDSLRAAYPRDLGPFHRITRTSSPDGLTHTVRIEHRREELDGQFLEATIRHQDGAVEIQWRSSDDTDPREPMRYTTENIGDVSTELRSQTLTENPAFENLDLPWDWFDYNVPRPQDVGQSLSDFGAAAAGWRIGPADLPQAERDALSRFPQQPGVFVVPVHTDEATGLPIGPDGDTLSAYQTAGVLAGLRHSGVWNGTDTVQFVACNLGRGPGHDLVVDVTKWLDTLGLGPKVLAGTGPVYFAPRAGGADGPGHLVVASDVGFTADGHPVMAAGGHWREFRAVRDDSGDVQVQVQDRQAYRAPDGSFHDHPDDHTLVESIAPEHRNPQAVKYAEPTPAQAAAAVALSLGHLTAAPPDSALRTFMGQIQSGAFTNLRNPEGRLIQREGTATFDKMMGNLRTFYNHAERLRPPEGDPNAEGTVLLYRAVRMDPQTRQQESFTEVLPSSTTYDRAFAQGWMSNPDRYALFEIRVPLSHPMLALSFPPGHAEAHDHLPEVNKTQYEVTLGPSQLTVTGREEDGPFHVIRADAEPMTLDQVTQTIAGWTNDTPMEHVFDLFAAFYSENALRAAFPKDLRPEHRITEHRSEDGRELTVAITPGDHPKLTGQNVTVHLRLAQDGALRVEVRNSVDLAYGDEPLVYDFTSGNVHEVSAFLEEGTLASTAPFDTINLPTDWYWTDPVPRAGEVGTPLSAFGGPGHGWWLGGEPSAAERHALERFPAQEGVFTLPVHTDESGRLLPLGTDPETGEPKELTEDRVAGILAGLHQGGVWNGTDRLQFVSCNLGKEPGVEFVTEVMRQLGRADLGSSALVATGPVYFTPRVDGTDGPGHLVVASAVGFTADGHPALVAGGHFREIHRPEGDDGPPVIVERGAHLPAAVHAEQDRDRPEGFEIAEPGTLDPNRRMEGALEFGRKNNKKTADPAPPVARAPDPVVRTLDTNSSEGVENALSGRQPSAGAQDVARPQEAAEGKGKQRADDPEPDSDVVAKPQEGPAKEPAAKGKERADDPEPDSAQAARLLLNDSLLRSLFATIDETVTYSVVGLELKGDKSWHTPEAVSSGDRDVPKESRSRQAAQRWAKDNDVWTQHGDAEVRGLHEAYERMKSWGFTQVPYARQASHGKPPEKPASLHRGGEPPRQPEGVLTVLSTRGTCDSCKSLVKDFQEAFPGISAYVGYAVPTTSKLPMTTSSRKTGWNKDGPELTINYGWGAMTGLGSTGAHVPTDKRMVFKYFPSKDGEAAWNQRLTDRAAAKAAEEEARRAEEAAAQLRRAEEAVAAAKADAENLLNREIRLMSARAVTAFARNFRNDEVEKFLAGLSAHVKGRNLAWYKKQIPADVEKALRYWFERDPRPDLAGSTA